VRLVVERDAAEAELDLGEEGRFYPSDQALARWQAATRGQATVVYEAGAA
jgi:DNA polymerase-3 subunit alpha